MTNGEYQEFLETGGYQNFRHWLSDGWAWVNANGAQSPLYWRRIKGARWHNTFNGLQPIGAAAPDCHVSHYEADAYARWRGQRLPTEFEWEVADGQSIKLGTAVGVDQLRLSALSRLYDGRRSRGRVQR